jgi:acyl-coenzyme A thioesterase 13
MPSLKFTPFCLFPPLPPTQPAMPDPAEPASVKAKAQVQAVFDLYHHLSATTPYTGFDSRLMSEVKLLDAGPEGSVTFELVVGQFYGNMNGLCF